MDLLDVILNDAPQLQVHNRLEVGVVATCGWVTVGGGDPNTGPDVAAGFD